MFQVGHITVAISKTIATHLNVCLVLCMYCSAHQTGVAMTFVSDLCDV